MHPFKNGVEDFKNQIENLKCENQSFEKKDISLTHNKFRNKCRNSRNAAAT